MKTTKLIRSITVAGALATALSLSACDMQVSFGSPDQDRSETQQPDEAAANPEEAQTNDPITEDSPDTSSSQGTSSGYGTSSDDGSTSSDGSSTSGTSTSAGSSSPSDASSTSSGSSSSSNEGSSSSSGENAGGNGAGFEIDEHGNGTIPASMLEGDIKDAYSKQGTTIDEVECLNDLMIVSERGSASCNVTAYGEKRYGTVKVTSVTGANVHYKLDFPSFN